MISGPKTEYRKELHYVAIKAKVKQENIPAQLPQLIPELFNWLNHKNIQPAGVPFFRYTNMEGGIMDVDVGIPTTSRVEGDQRVQPGSFPEGRYLTATYTGPYSNLPAVHSELNQWKEKNNIKAAGSVTEFYPTDPASEPDSEKWQTIILREIQDE